MRRVLILTLVAGLVLVMGSSAQATTRDVTDPPGDMSKFIEAEDGNVQSSRWAGAEGDIVFERIRHTATRVVVYMRFRQLSVPKQYAAFAFEIEGNNGLWAYLNMHTRHALPQGESESDCAHHTSHINYAGDSMWMGIPRGCLRNPKYVRVTGVSCAIRQKYDPYMDTRYCDNPGRDGGNYEQVFFGGRSPWVVTG